MADTEATAAELHAGDRDRSLGPDRAPRVAGPLTSDHASSFAPHRRRPGGRQVPEALEGTRRRPGPRHGRERRHARTGVSDRS